MPDDVAAAARLAEQLQVDPDGLRSYGRRAKTRTGHLRLVARYLGWTTPMTLQLKELDEFLLARAIEHDSPLLLLRLAIVQATCAILFSEVTPSTMRDCRLCCAHLPEDGPLVLPSSSAA